VEAAHIRAESDAAKIESDKADQEQERAFKAQQAEMNREQEKYVKSVEREIQIMEFAGNKDISLEQMRTLMASKAMELRNKRELFVAERDLKMSPANPTHQGL
jgi:hypothetical protein